MRIKHKRFKEMQKKYKKYGFEKTRRGYKKTVIG